MVTIFWFRRDLRISDNPGLLAAVKNGNVLPVYILDDASAGDFKIGAASRWWLHHSLLELNKSLDGKLNVYVGDSKKILTEIVRSNKVDAVYWNRCYEPFRIKDDSEIKTHLKTMGLDAQSFNASLLWEPWEILKADGTPYKVFTPFYQNGCLKAAAPREPLKAELGNLLKDEANKNTIESLNLLPNKPWYKGMENMWGIGEAAAQKQLQHFLDNGLLGYKEGRNYPVKDNTSRLSPYLQFGEISPNQIWHAAQMRTNTKNIADVEHFLRELGWREFSYHLLYHFPDLPRKNFQSKFDTFEWTYNETLLQAWKHGKTGYPIVDAGMRELWQTGYMHNRVRMIVASFLIKNLLIHWHHGEDWFWDCLIDADLANNSASWQWVAGSGADAAPYFRIFNPITQGQKFDPDGTYTRKFVPELSSIPDKFLFNPWEAPQEILRACGVRLGDTYPLPIVNLAASRNEALRIYKELSVD
jgi:deoxyribodipyrimidine photo-lyase